MASSLHPPRNLRKRRSTSAIREAQESQKKIEITTQPTTTTDTITEAVTEAAFDAAINTTNDIAETFLKSNTEAAQGASTNTPNATLGTVMIEADTTITAVDKEALLKHLRKPKEHSVPKSIHIYFYAHCCSCGQEEKTNREGTKCRNCRHERCPQCVG